MRNLENGEQQDVFKFYIVDPGTGEKTGAELVPLVIPGSTVLGGSVFTFDFAFWEACIDFTGFVMTTCDFLLSAHLSNAT